MKGRLEWQTGTVAVMRDLATDIREIIFELPVPLGRFQPGSHINVRVETPYGPALRTYTCVTAEDNRAVVAVKRHDNSRGGSAFMWRLAEGDRLDISLPENRFELSWTAPRYLMIAGGIGITPIAGMAQALMGRRAEVHVVYAAKSRAHMAYADELSATLGDRLRLFASDRGERINFAAEFAALDAGTEVYACGPIRMLNAVKRAWTAAGFPISRLRFEVFGDSGLFAEEPFEVEVLNRDVRVQVRPDQTLLEALTGAGVDMIYDCQRGECGLCAVGVLDHTGAIDHRDVFLSEVEKAEGSHMCACVSRFAGGRATIDVGYRT